MATHDEICAQAVDAIQQIDRDEVIAAFVSSLSTRNLPARSAFGSYVILQNFAAHEFLNCERFSGGQCAFCGLTASIRTEETPERIQNYPFQVQHTSIQYSAFDLATFKNRSWNAPKDDDRRRLVKIVESIKALPKSAQLSELNGAVQGIIRSNKYERMILLETFGYAGILCPSDQHHYTKEFVGDELANSNQPSHFYKREWAYPIRFWTGDDGMNDELLEAYFGAYL